MSPGERRRELLELLCRKRQETMKNLAEEFGVSIRTIRDDITELTLSYPITTVRGRYGGGVKVEDWYHLNRKNLNPMQLDLLKRIAPTLKGCDLATMNSIISEFAPY